MFLCLFDNFSLSGCFNFEHHKRKHHVSDHIFAAENWVSSDFQGRTGSFREGKECYFQEPASLHFVGLENTEKSDCKVK